MEERLAVGVSLAQVAREVGVRPDLLRRWGHAASAQRGANNRAATSESEVSELRRLRREIEVLRQERDFLKKASVYFAKESR
jgi:transposase